MKKKDQTTTKELTIPVSADDIMIGIKRAPKTIVAFEDFSCPSCRAQTEILDALIAKHPKVVKVVWKSLPVTQFPYPSEPVAKHALCAHRQNKFPEFKQLAFANSDNLSEKTLKMITETIPLDAKNLELCLSDAKTQSYIDTVKTLAILLNIQAVPTFFVDNKQIEPPQTVEGWEKVLNLLK